jgi:iron complex outermembrane recepter protein
MHSRFARALAALAFGMFGAFTNAQAQSTNPSSELAEIVVTAEKRSQPIDKVGMTISAFSGPTLQAQGIDNVADLAEIVPGLTYAHSNTGLPVYTLRGVGFYETSLAAYPAVSVYVDQVPLPFPLLTSHTTLDIERVEVLKGPQGTLFGQNSTGGAINFVAAKPTDFFTAGWDLTYGRFNRAAIDGFVSGPVTSTLAVRAAVSEETGGDWQKSYTRNDTLGAMHVFNGRLIADWKPLDALRFEFNVNGWVDKSEPQAAQLFKLNIQNPAVAPPALVNYPLAPENARSADWGPARPSGDQTLFQTSIRTEFDVTSDATITSLTSYVHGTRHDVLEPDGMSIDGYGLLPVGSINGLSEELRIANSDADRLRYTFGGMFEHQQVLDNGVLTFADSSLAHAFGFADNGLISNQIMTNAAIFGNLEFDVTAKNTLKAGARFTQSDRKDLGCTYDPGDGKIAGFFTFLSSLVRGTPTTPIKPGECTNLNTQFLPAIFSAKLNQNNVSWRVGDDYKPTDTLLIYANVAKGYKAGSFPQVAASSTVQLEPVTQESVIDYEMGFKKQMLNHRVSLDGAIFYYGYKDKQLRSKYVDPVFGVLDKLANIPKSSIKGVEMSLNANLIAGLRANVSVTYLDSAVNEFVGVNGLGIQSNYAGTSIPFAPKFSTTAGLEYDWPLSNTLTGFAGANVTTNSKTYSVVGNDPASLIESFVLVDVRAGVETTDGRWRAQLWGKNITDRYYWTNAVVVYDQEVRYAGQPATFGITASYRYK